MCLVISFFFLALSYSFFEDGNMMGFGINFTIGILFAVLMVRNVLKTKKDRESK